MAEESSRVDKDSCLQTCVVHLHMAAKPRFALWQRSAPLLRSIDTSIRPISAASVRASYSSACARIWLAIAISAGSGGESRSTKKQQVAGVRRVGFVSSDQREGNRTEDSACSRQKKVPQQQARSTRASREPARRRGGGLILFVYPPNRKLLSCKLRAAQSRREDGPNLEPGS